MSKPQATTQPDPAAILAQSAKLLAQGKQIRAAVAKSFGIAQGK